MRERYSQTAMQVSCGSGGCGSESQVYDPKDLKGIPLDAIRASRGCADPHAFAELAEGERVLDLGCGGGIDCLLAAREVGESGRVVGLDMTGAMLDLARANLKESGMVNVSFEKGYLEEMPFDDASFDVIISNCVINLCSDKLAVLREASRVLASGGRFVVADIVMLSDLDDESRDSMTAYLGCGSRILTEAEYVGMLEESGFVAASVEVQRVYDERYLEDRSKRKRLEEQFAALDLEKVAGSFAGAMVLARKA